MKQTYPHAELVERVFGVSVKYWPMAVTAIPHPLTSNCEERLRYAKGLIDRIDEVTCGLWELEQMRRNRTLVKFVFIKARASSKFLTEVGILPLKHKFAEVFEEDRETVTIKVRFGDGECRTAFSIYASALLGKNDLLNEKKRPLLMVTRQKAPIYKMGPVTVAPYPAPPKVP